MIRNLTQPLILTLIVTFTAPQHLHPARQDPFLKPSPTLTLTPTLPT